MRNTRELIPALLAGFGLPAAILAQSYSIDWYKVSGGGGTRSGGTNSVTISPPTGTLYIRLKQ